MLDLDGMISRERPDGSLSQGFYIDHDVFKLEMSRIVARQWLYAGHVSRIAHRGDYFLFDIGADSVIVARQEDGSVRAFHNVCGHRGSRICLEREGSGRRFTCPYHAWSYGLDGKLLAAPYMPDDFDKSGSPLKSCPVRVLEGLIFVCLSPDHETAFDEMEVALAPLLARNALVDAKLAVRRAYPTRANWKLVVDNFLECYHCGPSHKLYSSTHSPAKLLAYLSDRGRSVEKAHADYAAEYAVWQESAVRAGTWLDAVVASADGCGLWSGSRDVVKAGSVTESPSGQPLAPLMGSCVWDGGQTGCMFNVFSFCLANNDHVVTIRFTPRTPDLTDVEFEWYVAPEAAEGRDYDPDELARLWHVTTLEDKQITEDNHAGVMSSAYTPGRFSLLESRLAVTKAWYLKQMANSTPDAQPLEPAASGHGCQPIPEPETMQV